MQQPGPDSRYRDEDGRIAKKHGNTLIGTLRQTYGPRFAHAFADDQKLGDVLDRVDEESLSQLLEAEAWGTSR